MAAVADHRRRCFVCGASGRGFAGTLRYFSIGRGRWWTLFFCPRHAAQALSDALERSERRG